jgi:MFS family permease
MGSPVSALQLHEGQDKRIWVFLLTAKERGALIATFAGWMLDGMDVMVYSFVLPTLILTWHITKPQAGMLGTSALLISSIGGWIAGIAADRFGRVTVLKLAILWFAFFTFLSGFTNSFGQLLAVRGLQGLGFGGEWAVGSVLIGESIRSKFRGKAVGTVQGGWAIGWGIAAIFYTVFFSVLPAAIAWRAMFWIGILPAFLVFYIRRNVPEPDVFTALDRSRDASSQGRALAIFSPALLRITVLASLVAMGAQGGYYAVTTWLPLYLKTTYHLTTIGTGASLLVIITGSFSGYLLSAYLTDQIGRRLTLVLFAACSLITVMLYSSVPLSSSLTLILGFPLGFFPSGSFSPMGSFLTELFPTGVRASGQGFTYNLGRGVGALFPTLVGYFSSHVSLGRAIAFFAALAYLTMILAVWMLPETQGSDLKT